MNKIAIITDLHFGANNDDINYLMYQIRFFKEELLGSILKQNINTIICLGDVHHNRKSININTLNILKKEFFDVLKEKNISLITIPGNHDIYYTNSSLVNSLHVYDDYENIRILNKPTILKLGNTNFLFVPWISNKEELEVSKEFIEKNKSTCDILLGHFEFKDFLIAKGVVSEHGFLNYKDYFVFNKILSGHYHIKQQVNNVHYLGSLWDISWNDYGDERGYHILNTDTKELEFIKNQNSFHIKYLIDNDNYQNVIDEMRLNPNRKFKINLSGNLSYNNKEIVKGFLNTEFTKPENINSLIENDDEDDLNNKNNEIELKNMGSVLDLINEYIDKNDNLTNKNKIKNFLNQVVNQ